MRIRRRLRKILSSIVITPVNVTESLQPIFGTALNNIGALYYHQRNYEKAKEHYNKALESGDNRALRNLGILYIEQKEYEKAEEYFKKAIDTGDNNSLNNLRILYTEQNEHIKLEELKQKYKI